MLKLACRRGVKITALRRFERKLQGYGHLLYIDLAVKLGNCAYQSNTDGVSEGEKSRFAFFVERCIKAINSG